LLHPLLVTLNKLFGQLSNNLDFLAGSLHLDHSDNLHDALLDLHVHWLHLERTALDLGMVQGVVNVIKHQNAAEFDDLDVLPLDWVLLSSEQQVSEVNRRGQRRTHLVGDVRTIHRS
jgi:hypothetical protein